MDGTFQNFQVPGRRAPDGTVTTPPEFYTDVAVIAYKIPDGDKTQAELIPRVTASSGTPDMITTAALSDGDVNTVALDLPASAPGNESWILFDYGSVRKPQMIQAVTLASLNDAISVFDHESPAIPPHLEASDDGKNFRKIADIPFSSIVQRTASFDAVTARYFRLVFPAQPAGVVEHDHKITELVLTSGARVNEFEKRAGYANARDFYAITDPKVAPQFIVSQSDVIDLTSKMQPDGTLDWTPPPGVWQVLRIGSSLTGHENGPAPAEATGLEVDKLNRDYVKNYVDGYLKMYADTVGPDNDGRERHLVAADRQHRSGTAELDRSHPRRVPETARLRSAAVAPGAHRYYTSKAPRTPTASCGTSAAPSASCSPKITTAKSPKTCTVTA